MINEAHIVDHPTPDHLAEVSESHIIAPSKVKPLPHDGKKELHPKHISHDYPLFKSLTLSFLVVLFGGLFVSRMIAVFLEEHLPLESSLTDQAPPNWKHYENDGSIELLRRPIPGTRLYAHRAVTTVALPLNDVMKVFRDTPNSSVWVKDLVETEEWHKSAHKEENKFVEIAVVRQRFKIPVPGVEDREYIMLRTLTTEEATDGSGRTSVTADFASFEDDEEYPICGKCVRGHNYGSKWTFTPLEGDKQTRIEADIAVDPHVKKISPAFVNFVQKRWPVETLKGLVQAAWHHHAMLSDTQIG